MVDYTTLTNYWTDSIECFVLESTTSTNDYLLNLPFSSHNQVCIAREQTAGKGQYQRQWLSQKDSSVLLSIRRLFALNTSLNGLSLALGLSVIDTLEKEYQIKNIQLKWPNDVYFDDKKLAGILIENRKQNQQQSIVMGLGLNYHLSADFNCTTPWVDLSTISQNLPDLVELQATLVQNLLHDCQRFEQGGLAVFQTQWRRHDYLLGKSLTLNYQGKPVIGVARGINAQGALVVDLGDTHVDVHSSEQMDLS